MKNTFVFLFAVMSLYGFQGTGDKPQAHPGTILITWEDHVKGEFSFRKKWSYGESVFRNDSGQLICDFICNPRLDNMRDSNGMIIKDSMTAYYSLLDTTHLFHSIDCEAWTYGWAGTDFFKIGKAGPDSFFGHTTCSGGQYSSLNMTIKGNLCHPYIRFLSPAADDGLHIYNCNSGNIQIDRTYWKKGIMRATFSFTFENPEAPKKPMYCRGRIFAYIENNP